MTGVCTNYAQNLESHTLILRRDWRNPETEHMLKILGFHKNTQKIFCDKPVVYNHVILNMLVLSWYVKCTAEVIFWK